MFLSLHSKSLRNAYQRTDKHNKSDPIYAKPKEFTFKARIWWCNHVNCPYTQWCVSRNKVSIPFLLHRHHPTKFKNFSSEQLLPFRVICSRSIGNLPDSLKLDFVKGWGRHQAEKHQRELSTSGDLQIAGNSQEMKALCFKLYLWLLR